MSRLRTIAAIPAGSWTKWVVVGFWVVVLVVMYPLSTRRMGAEKNDLKYWWWPSALARTPDPAPAELGQERAAVLVAGGTS
jgi:hypothetical protein